MFKMPLKLVCENALEICMFKMPLKSVYEISDIFLSFFFSRKSNNPLKVNMKMP